ncbi:MAG: glycosyltransferase [Ilumatobacteraceae bacterium]
MRVAVVVPTYNEADNLGRLVDGLRRANATAQIVVVDDASPDGTGQLADELARSDDHLRVIHRTAKAGIGSAYRAGFAAALDGRRRCRGADGRRPLPRARRRRRARRHRGTGRRPRHRIALRPRRPHGQLARRPPPSVTLGQPLRRRHARSRHQRRHRRLPRLLGVGAAADGVRHRRRQRLRLPGGDDAPPDPSRRPDRRVPDHVRRSPSGRIEDVRWHRARGPRARRAPVGRRPAGPSPPAAQRG